MGILLVLIKNSVVDDGVSSILQYRSSDLYLTDRKETMAILQKKNTHTPLILARCPFVARNIKILWEKRMNEGRPYLQMWRGVRVVIVSFLSVRYRSNGPYSTTPHWPKQVYIIEKTLSSNYLSTSIKSRVGDDGVPAILQYRPSDLYLTDRKETMTICK